MNKILLFLFILVPSILCAQETIIIKPHRSVTSLNIGVNYSKFNSKDARYDYGAKIQAGVSNKIRLNEDLNFKSSLCYSMKGSSSNSPFRKIENHYLELSLLPQYEFIQGYFIHGGLSLSKLLFALEVQPYNKSWNGMRRYLIDGFNSEINYLAGIEFKFLENINLELNYIIPAAKYNTSCFQITANIYFNKKKSKKKYTDIKIEKSDTQISDLKSGVLLVRLHNSKKVIDEMVRHGNIKEANELDEYNRLQNLSIISAFNNYYNFSEVRFFYSSNSNKISNRDFKDIFLSDSLITDNSLRVEANKPLFIAEFTDIVSDTAKYYSHTSISQDTTVRYKKTDNFYNLSNIQFYGLVVKDSNFVQLSHPFPYYVKSSRSFFFKDLRHILFLDDKFTGQMRKSFDESVISLNNNLYDYYNLVKK